MDIPEIDSLTIKKSNKRKLRSTNLQQDIPENQPDSDPRYISNTDQPNIEEIIQTEIQAPDDEHLPPDPIELAHSLFQYFQQYLQFYEDMNEHGFNMFAEDTITELSHLISQSSPCSESQENSGEEK